MPAEFLNNLPKNLTTHLPHKLYSAFPNKNETRFWANRQGTQRSVSGNGVMRYEKNDKDRGSSCSIGYDGKQSDRLRRRCFRSNLRDYP